MQSSQISTQVLPIPVDTGSPSGVVQLASLFTDPTTKYIALTLDIGKHKLLIIILFTKLKRFVEIRISQQF
jgi:hypothetical protein